MKIQQQPAERSAVPAHAVSPVAVVAPAARGERYDAASLYAVAAFAIYTAAGLAGAGGKLLELTFPAGAAFVALVVYSRSPATYIAFTWWIWLLTPLVRRLFDLRYGFHPTSTLLIAPLAVTVVSGLTVLRRRRLLRSSAYVPFLIGGVALMYAFMVGLIRQSFGAATYDMLTWIAPVLFGMHLALEWRQFGTTRAAITSAVVWGLAITSVYAIFQFIQPPIWDKTWVVNAEMYSVGSPMPFLIRVFSTLNAPGPFSVMLVFSLLIGLASPQRWRILALAVGLVALILSKGRSAWGAFVLGALVMQLRQPLRTLPRQWLAFAFVFLLAAPVITQPKVLSVLTRRAATLRNVEKDNSFITRVSSTRVVLQYMYDNPAGVGLGKLGGAAKLSSGQKSALALDSAPLEIFSVMGWLGGTFYMMALAAIIIPILRTRRVRFEPVTSAASAVVVALLFASLFGNIFNSVSGFYFWTAVGLATAGRTYASAVELAARLEQLRKQTTATTTVQPSAA